MDPITQYLEKNQDRHLEELKKLLRIPSVSAQSKHREDVKRCAEHIAGYLKDAGMPRAEVVPTAGNPVVYAEWLGAPGAPTALIYGHYDVQPPEPLELWNPPGSAFDPQVRDGKLFARGACDDKGQVFMHLAAVEAHLAVNGRLPVNVKMMIEGEEEVGSRNLKTFIRSHKEELKSDVLVVSDTNMVGPDQPALTYGLRGILYCEVEVTGPSRDLHSGEFGGAVQNPAIALGVILSALKDGDGRITIPGFYDGVRPLTPAERENMKSLAAYEPGFIGEAHVPEPFGERGYSTFERTWMRPTLDVNGIWGGYIGEGSKTIIPSKATAKISMRLVPDQDAQALGPRVEAYIQRLKPPGVTVEVRSLHGAAPFIMDPEHPMLDAARRALKRAWSKPPVMIREGGSIPVTSTFQKELGIPVILMGFGLHDDSVHAPNEKFSLTSFYGGTRSAAYLYEELAR